MDFSDRLKELRENAKMTQEDLAKVLGVVRPTIAGYETKGKQPSYDILLKLSEVFNCSTDYLLGAVPYKLDNHPVSETLAPDFEVQRILEALEKNNNLKTVLKIVIDMSQKDLKTIEIVARGIKESNLL